MKKNILVVVCAAVFLAAWGGTRVSGRVIDDDTDTVRLTVEADLGRETISRFIYGHFSEHLGRCIYGGFWVGEESAVPNLRGIRTDVVEALRRIRIPVLRWPGGCFADEYHWKDGVGPRERRPEMLNTHWGRVTENNQFGTHEFLDLCQQLDCEPYVCGNVGSGTVDEMRQWVEYITFEGPSPMADWRRRNGRTEPWRLKFFGVGNENWGCGGNMRPEYYADLYRRYQTYVRNLSGNRITRIACGGYGDDAEWTEVLMREAGELMDGLSFHYYTVPGGWGNKNSATEFGRAEWIDTVRKALLIDDHIGRQAEVMDRFDQEKRVALIVDEWGTWYDVEPGTNPGFLYQQNTVRDAVVAGLTLNIFNNRCDRVKMANLAQTINVLQAVILTEGEKMLLTPTYHVFDMYRVHQNATLLPTRFEGERPVFGDEPIPTVSVSASLAADGRVHISLCNLDPDRARPVAAELRGLVPRAVRGRLLTGPAMNAHNTFDDPDAVRPVEFESAAVRDGKVELILPPHSVVVLEVDV